VDAFVDCQRVADSKTRTTRRTGKRFLASVTALMRDKSAARTESTTARHARKRFLAGVYEGVPQEGARSRESVAAFPA